MIWYSQFLWVTEQEWCSCGVWFLVVRGTLVPCGSLVIIGTLLACGSFPHVALFAHLGHSVCMALFTPMVPSRMWHSSLIWVTRIGWHSPHPWFLSANGALLGIGSLVTSWYFLESWFLLRLGTLGSIGSLWVFGILGGNGSSPCVALTAHMGYSQPMVLFTTVVPLSFWCSLDKWVTFFTWDSLMAWLLCDDGTRY